MEIKAICSQHDAQSEPLLLDFAIKDSSSTKEDKFNVDYLETASCCNSFPTRLATVTAPKSNNVSTEDTTIPLELFSIAAGLLVVFVLLIVCIVVVASFVLKRRWTRNRSDIKVLIVLLMYSEACSIACMHVMFIIYVGKEH
jgi:hypothetical protein